MIRKYIDSRYLKQDTYVIGGESAENPGAGVGGWEYMPASKIR